MSGRPTLAGQLGVVVDVLVVPAGQRPGDDERPGDRQDEVVQGVAHRDLVVPAGLHQFATPIASPAVVTRAAISPAQAGELSARAAEQQLDLLAPEEVPVDRVRDVRAHPAVQVLGGMDDPLAPLGRLPLGDRDRLG